MNYTDENIDFAVFMIFDSKVLDDEINTVKSENNQRLQWSVLVTVIVVSLFMIMILVLGL